VDLLMEAGYRVHLANPSAIKQYEGLQYSDDRHDAFGLAHLLRLGILPEGYFYPKQQRPVRDLLRKRGHLMWLRSSLILSLQNMISNHCAMALNANGIKKITEDLVVPVFVGQEELKLSAQVSKESIDFLTRKIRQLETVVECKVKLTKPFRYLQTIPGNGRSHTRETRFFPCQRAF
jgi:transposase